MCAINGFNFIDRDLISSMNLATNHRGPDSTGFYEDASRGYTFGHNRLSIIDTEPRSNQPMVFSNGEIVITYNGELYNFNEIKKELSGNFDYKTKSDTEVIISAYLTWGKRMFEKFNGIFSMAIYDRRNDLILIARDRFGVKPLYYYTKNGKFIFSSEVKAILKYGVERKINSNVLPHFLNLLYVPGEETLFKDIHRLPASSYGVYKDGKLQISKYEVPKRIHRNNDLVSVMNEAVSDQLVSDKPIGLYLSGGLDSSILLHSMKDKVNDIKTFSIGFDIDKDKERDKYNADFLLARETAKHYGTIHSELFVRHEQIIDALEKSIWHLDEPVSNPTIIPMYLISGLAKKDVDVVLSGDGGDELFGGYERYRYSRIIDLYRKSPKLFRNIMSKTYIGNKLNTEPGVERVVRFMFQDQKVLHKLFGEDFPLDRTIEYFRDHYPYDRKKDSADYMMEVDQRTWLINESLLRSDKLAMANGLEVRVPFLNNNVIDYSSTIDISDKVSVFRTKKIVRDSYKNLLPAYLINQPKRGWFSPGSKWLRNKEVYGFVKDVLKEDVGIPINNEEIIKLLDDHVEMRGYYLNIIWPILTIKLWMKIFRVSS